MKSIEFALLLPEYIEAVHQYREKAFPDRVVQEHDLEFRILTNPFYDGIPKSVVAFEQERVVGLLLTMPSFVKHKKHVNIIL